MRAILLLLITLLIPRLGFTAQAGVFHFENRAALGFEMKEEAWQRFAAKVYRFVTGVIPDSRPGEPIRVVFDPEVECAGFVSRQSEALREIRISTRIRSHVDFQVVLAHELTHVLRHLRQPDEAHWLDEGLAKWMEWEYIGDFPAHYVDELQSSPVVKLLDQPLDCRSGTGGYAATYFLMLYFRNHLGGRAFMAEIAQSTRKGWENVEAAALELRRRGVIGIPAERLERGSLLKHFSLALAVNDAFVADFALLQIDPRYRPWPRASFRVWAAANEAQARCFSYEIWKTEPSWAIRRARSAQAGNLEVCLD